MPSETTQVTRQHDHLYDPTWAVSGQKDHNRVLANATRARLERVCEYNGFFSEIPAKYPAHSIRLKAQDMVPKEISRSWTGPKGAEPPVAAKMAEAKVTSENRYKYFKRPVIPMLSAAPAEVVLAKESMEAREQQHNAAASRVDPLEQPPLEIDDNGMKSVGVQSMFREAEAQTQPYTPDYTMEPGAQPELLTLATLTFENGLPPSADEIAQVLRARHKRNFEALLPPITDEVSFELRRNLMQEEELKDWSKREEEMVKLHAERLDKIRQALMARSEEKEKFNEVRLAQIEQQKLMEQERFAQKHQIDRIKTLRKITGGKKLSDFMVRQNNLRRNIIREYSDEGATTYAPVTRMGRFPDKNAGRYETTAASMDYDGLCALEKFMPRSAIETAVSLDTGKKRMSDEDRRMARLGNALTQIDNLIKTGSMEPQPNEEEEESGGVVKYAGYKPKKLQERPPTPSRPGADEDHDRANALVMLQRLIRGRAVQNVMFEGKEKRYELIRELRSSESDIKNSDDERQEDMEALDASMCTTTLDAVGGHMVSGALDYLSKELVRFRQEQEIAEYVRNAEELRRQREAEESGRRQEEEVLRTREEYQTSHVQEVNEETADTLVDSWLSTACDEVAGNWAVEDELAVKDNDDSNQSTTAPVRIQRLLTQFLYPEVEREQIRRKVRMDQQKYKDAVRSAVFKSTYRVEQEKAALEGTQKSEE